MVSPALIHEIFLAVTLLFLFFAAFRPYFGLLAYLIIFYTRFGELYPFLGEIRLELIAGIYIAGLIFLKTGFGRISPGFNPLNKALWGFLLVVLLSIPQAVKPAVAMEWGIDFLKIMAFFAMVATLIRTEKELNGFVWVLILMSFWIAYEPASNYWSGQFIIAQNVKRVVGTTGYFHNPNALGNTIVQTIPFMVYLAVSSSFWKRLVLLAILAFCIFTIIVTGSRGAFAGLTVAFLLIAWQNRRRTGILLLVLVALAAIFWNLSGEYRTRHLTTLEFGRSDLSAHSRIDGLIHGLSMMAKRPILGVGIGNYPEARREWFGWGLWAHNQYGELFGELGLAGTLTWFWFLVLLFANLKRLKKEMQKRSLEKHWIFHLLGATEVALVVRLFLGLGNHSLYLFFWYMVAGMILAASQIVQVLAVPLPGQGKERPLEARASLAIKETAR